ETSENCCNAPEVRQDRSRGQARSAPPPEWAMLGCALARARDHALNFLKLLTRVVGRVAAACCRATRLKQACELQVSGLSERTSAGRTGHHSCGTSACTDPPASEPRNRRCAASTSQNPTPCSRSVWESRA